MNCTSQQKKPIFDFRGIYLNSGILHHQLIGIELCSDQLWINFWEPGRNEAIINVPGEGYVQGGMVPKVALFHSWNIRDETLVMDFIIILLTYYINSG